MEWNPGKSIHQLFNSKNLNSNMISHDIFSYLKWRSCYPVTKARPSAFPTPVMKITTLNANSPIGVCLLDPTSNKHFKWLETKRLKRCFEARNRNASFQFTSSSTWMPETSHLRSIFLTILIMTWTWNVRKLSSSMIEDQFLKNIYSHIKNVL